MSLYWKPFREFQSPYNEIQWSFVLSGSYLTPQSHLWCSPSDHYIVTTLDFFSISQTLQCLYHCRVLMLAHPSAEILFSLTQPHNLSLPSLFLLIFWVSVYVIYSEKSLILLTKSKLGTLIICLHSRLYFAFIAFNSIK